MSRSAAVAVENNFKSGLITEATGLNFPENACTDTYDCEFSLDGSVQRRLGFDYEEDYTTKTIDRANNVITSYVWKNVAGNGDVTVVVVQIGNTLYFYRTDSSGLSSGAVADTVTLTPVLGAPASNSTEAQFSDGNGYLFVTHQYCEPMRISYNTSTDVVTETNILLSIRDFEGAVDDLAIEDRPTVTLTSMTDTHEYNLRNQGWNTTNLTAWDAAQTTMPSNADVMWRFVNATGDFDASTASINRITLGNTPAPKGHYILTLSLQNRDAAAGTSGVSTTTTGQYRPSTSAFFAGRVFYSGIKTAGFNSKIYFTQIVERDEQYAFCYQTNDPTGEDLFDLLSIDGGVISIPEAGTIRKLVTVPGGLSIFADNGVWFITGSTGLGFTANDYTVQKVAAIQTISTSSFVDVGGYPCWWNAEGIYILSVEGNSPTIKSLTDSKIQDFFLAIPLNSRRNAKGVYNSVNGKIQWLYKSEDTDQISDRYIYDRVLNFNTLTGAFFPWTISNSTVKVHSILVSDSVVGEITVDTVVDGADTVVDGANTVIAFTTPGNTSDPIFKFLVSYLDGSSYKFTFAETNDLTRYRDWYTYDTTGVDFTSYFITGYKIRGEGIRKFQNNWLKVFSRLTEAVSYTVRGLWDYATTNTGTGRWSSAQTVVHSDLSYSTATRRLKIRGHGLVLQFKVESTSGIPFNIIGWSTLESANQIP